MTTTTRTVALEKIRTDGGTRIRDLDEANVLRLVAVLEEKKPFDEDIRAWFDGADYWLSHGFHRHEAYKRVGRGKVSIVVMQGTKEDAFDDACKPHNDHNGRYETTKEKAARIKAFESRHPDMGLRKIAEWCGCDHTTVKKYRDERKGVGNPTPPTDSGMPPWPDVADEVKGKPAKQPRKPSSVAVLDDADDDEPDGDPADEIEPVPGPSVFNVALALVKLENAVMAQLAAWPEEDKPEAADRLEWIAKNVRDATEPKEDPR